MLTWPFSMLTCPQNGRQRGEASRFKFHASIYLHISRDGRFRKRITISHGGAIPTHADRNSLCKKQHERNHL